VDDGRARLSGRLARELALGRERDPGDARTAIAGGLADEEHRCIGARFEIAVEAFGEPVVAVLVERLADSRRCEPLYQRSQWMTSSRPRRR